MVDIQITVLEPMITGLQEALPKSIGLLPFDGGVAGKLWNYAVVQKIWNVPISFCKFKRSLIE